MELQKHGIGSSSPVATGTVTASGAQPAAGASSAAAAVSGHGAAVTSTSNNSGMSQTDLSIAAAVGAALVVLLAALRMRRRKREGVAGAEAALADEGAASARVSDPRDTVATREQAPVHEVSGANGDEAVRRAAVAATERAAAERSAAEQLAAEHAAAEHAAAERAAEEQAAAERVAADQAATEHAAAQTPADRAGADHEPAAQQSHADFPTQDPKPSQHDWQERHGASAPFEPAQPDANSLPTTGSGLTSEPLPAAHQDNLDRATTAASLAAAAELGAEALPLTPLEPVEEAFPQEEPARSLQWDEEPAPGAPSAPQEPSAELHTALPPGRPYHDLPTHPLPETSAQAVAPTEFPRDAVDAFSSLDMPLPPRIESPADSVQAPASLTTQPVAAPETTAQQALAPHDPDDVPHIADEITAGTAGHPAVAGLGAAGFGALKLDFDLELPPSLAQPLPAFTPADLIRIARNKLDLASEYIELGDLSGARALINEVIEANDPATRTEARALLSTLAPLS